MKTHELAAWLHNTYEKLAIETGWHTQESCRTAFIDLPRANQQLMMLMAHEIKQLDDMQIANELKAFKMLSELLARVYALLDYPNIKNHIESEHAGDLMDYMELCKQFVMKSGTTIHWKVKFTEGGIITGEPTRGVVPKGEPVVPGSTDELDRICKKFLEEVEKVSRIIHELKQFKAKSGNRE